jgi:hypothetical protein
MRNLRIILNWILGGYVVRKEVSGADDVRVCCQAAILEVLNTGSAAGVGLIVVFSA